MGLYVDAKFDVKNSSHGDNGGGNAGYFSPVGTMYLVHSASPDFKIGLGIGTYFGLGVNYTNEWSGKYYVQSASCTTMAVNPTIACNIADWFSVGGGVSPGMPVVFGSTSTNIDMKTGALCIGSPELSQMVAAHAQLARYYGIPSRSGGALTDASYPDAQAGFESMMGLLTTANSGVDFVLHAAGILSSYLAFSYEKFVLDDEMCGMVRRLRRGFVVSPETLAYDVIAKVGSGGNYLMEDHTVERCRSEFWKPGVCDRGGLEAWQAVRARAADPVEFVQRHLLRGGGGGRDPRERALQAVVELGVKVADPIRRQALVERASQVFRQPERVIARAMDLRRSGQPSAQPVEAAVRHQRAGESSAERRLLEALLHRPESLAEVRELVAPGDFGDPAHAALAEWIWSGQAGWPPQDEAAALARELAASEPEDWEAEARGAARRLRQRGLAAACREKEQEWARAPGGPEAARLMQEIQQLRQEIRELEALIRIPSR